MKARINLAVLKTTRLDSGALGPLGMVLRQFGKVGMYHVGVYQAGRSVADTHLQVDDAGPTQLNIDLATVAKAAVRRGHLDCECRERGRESPVVSPKGYVLFHVHERAGADAAARRRARATRSRLRAKTRKWFSIARS